MSYWKRRFLSTVLVVLAIVSLSDFMTQLIPGDPVERYLGPMASASQKNQIRKELGLDEPMTVRYLNYLQRLAQGDLGRSIYSQRNVSQLLADRIPRTFLLAIPAVSLGFLFALSFGGLIHVLFTESTSAKIVRSVSLPGLALPAVVLGPLLIQYFAVRNSWLPISGSESWRHLILPVLSLAIPLGASMLRMVSGSLLSVLTSPYMATAKAKGLGPTRLVFSHALPNAMISVSTVFALQMGAVLTGTVITETIFDWPGLGTLLYSALQSRDYPVIQGCVLFIALTYVSINLISDLTVAYLNPRVQFSENRTPTGVSSGVSS